MTLEAIGQFIVWAAFIAYGKDAAKQIFGDFEASRIRKRRDTLKIWVYNLHEAMRKYDCQA